MTEQKIIEAKASAQKVLSGEADAGRQVQADMRESDAIEAAFDKRKMWRKINRHTRPRSWRSYWVAAAAAIVVVVGGWLMFGRNGGEQASPHAAMLVLDGGREIALRGDTVVMVDGVEVEVVDGRVRYAAAAQRLALQVPHGVEPLSVELDDGSTVWLNSGSRLSYPARFEGTLREVELTGEAFFEVSRDENHPFVVRSGAMTTTVLGTTFNVNAYADEPAVETTLVSGSVRVEAEGGASQVLTPSMQASLNNGGLIIKRVDVAAATAWRSGMMILDETDLQQIMRTLVRWYDIEVEYVDAAAGHNFTGRLYRADGLVGTLETLTMLGAPRFEVQGKRVRVH